MLMKPYRSLLEAVIDRGESRNDRTGTGTLSLFGAQMRFNLGNGFPLLTLRKLHFHSIVQELLWMLRGETNISYLKAHKVTIWDEWADSEGELGPVYGSQWRRWPGKDGEAIDQIARVIREIREFPVSRRLVVSAWNVADIPNMALPPCHALFQFHVSNEGRLSCHLYQRSADLFLGVPFNIASYALLTHMIAHVCQLGVGDLVHTFGDVHLYKNHMGQACLLLSRKDRQAPVLDLDSTVRNIDDFREEHILLNGYDPHPAISAKVSV